MTIFFVIEVFYMEDVLLFSLNAIDIYYKKVMVATLSLPTTASKSSLVVLVFFAGLALMDERLLRVLPTRYLSRENVSGFILPKVFLFFFCKLVLSEHLALISQLLGGGCNNAFASV